MRLGDSPLLTDLYQLTMLQGYFDHGMIDQAVFEFFVRKLPPNRNFLIAAGLEQVLQFLEGFAFTADELDWLGESMPCQKALSSFPMNRSFASRRQCPRLKS